MQRTRGAHQPPVEGGREEICTRNKHETWIRRRMMKNDCQRRSRENIFLLRIKRYKILFIINIKCATTTL